jgi:hypothetical protein
MVPKRGSFLSYFWNIVLGVWSTGNKMIEHVYLYGGDSETSLSNIVLHETCHICIVVSSKIQFPWTRLTKQKTSKLISEGCAAKCVRCIMLVYQ